MKKVLMSISAVCCMITTTLAQTASVTTWKHEKKAAYSIIHDDYGSSVVDGIWQYADTIASNRGIKFTIGAISGECEKDRNINGYSNPYEYAKEVMMADHKHEIIAHSHTHTCAVGNLWSPCDVGAGKGWAESGDFADEIVGCTNSIEQGTGHKPQYYIYPYDKFTNLANDKLKELGYIGSRSGWTSALDESFYRNGYNANDLHSFYPDADGFFRTSVQVFDSDDTESPNHELILNSVVDDVIANNEWGNRELHNVGTYGWGSVSVDGYRKHLDYLQQKVESGDLWVGTVSEILTYQIQKLKYEPNLSETGESTWVVEWASINPQYDIDVADYLSNLNYTSSLTLKVDFEGKSGEWIITQNGQPVPYEIKNKIFYLNVYPHQGAITFELKNETFPAPVAENPIVDTKLPMEFDFFSIDLNHVFEDANTLDENLIYAVSGNTNINISIDKGIASLSSNIGWEGVDTIVFSAMDESNKFGYDTVIFTVNGANEPYTGTPISIPSKIEAEDFDLGGVGVAFHEEDNYNIDNYRDEEVDIKNDNGFTVLMEDKEWLEYTIQVDTEGYYDIDVFSHSETLNSALILTLNKELLKTFQLKYFFDSVKFESNKLYNVHLKAGKYVLRVLAEGKSEIDYIEVTTPGVNTLPTIVTNIPDQELVPSFVTYTLDLKDVFEDLETKAIDLTYSTVGDTNVVISITDGVATISSTPDWQGVETIIFSATDFSGASINDTVLFNVSEEFAVPNHSVNDKQGYIFTFDQSEALNCPETMLGGFGEGYTIESAGGGSLVISSDGTQFGYHNVALGLNDTCKNILIDLSHPEKRILEVRVHSTVDVPQFLLAVGDTARTIADRDIQIHSLKANEWHTLTFEFNSLETWGGKVMDPTTIDFVTLQFRKSWHGTAQEIAGTFTIDYIKVGGAIVCPDPVITSELESYPELLFGGDIGTDASLEVYTLGKANFQWFKNDTLIVDNDLYLGTNSSELIIKDFIESDTGIYYCEIKDECGASIKSQNKQLIVGDLNIPFHGDPVNVPGKIEAEDYDIGGQGISYFERNVPGQEYGNTYRNDDVDLYEMEDGSYVLTTVRHWEWLEYTVNVADSGLYDFEFLAYVVEDETFAIMSLDGDSLTTLEMEYDANDISFKKNTQRDVFLPAGEHVIRLRFYRGFSVDYIIVKKAGSPIVTEVGDQEVQQNSSIEINLNDAFNDVKTEDSKLIYSYSGDSTLTVNIVDGIATITAGSDFLGVETLTFFAQDEDTLISDMVVDINVIAPTGSIEELEDQHFSIYPNPVSSILTIDSEDIDTEVEVLDSRGVTIFISKNSNRIDVSSLPSGIYFLKQGNARVKFIKE